MNLQTLKELLREHDVITSTELDQHFITSEDVLQREVEYAGITETDTVLEIGPGPGILTEFLVKAGNMPITVIEKDWQFESILNKLNVTVTIADAMKTEWPEASVVMSNVPYSISSPLLFKILETNFRVAVLCLQKEFVDRMIAQPGSQNYARLSVNTSLRATVEKMEDVPKTLFYPQPRVDSAIVRLTPKNVELPVNFSDICRKLFNRKNKKARNNLEGYEGEFAERRVVSLTPEEIVMIAEEFE